MHLTILAVPDCPNAPALADRVAAAIKGRPGITVAREVITNDADAVRWRMRGSPALLIDGADPFASPDQPVSLSCRVYAGTGGVPSVSQIRTALNGADAAHAANARGWMRSATRAGRGRIAPVERRQRAVHQSILRSFVRTGTAPSGTELSAAAAPQELEAVLKALADADFLCLDDTGRITAAYPFSASPTRHRVKMPGGQAFAMCAIDALGVSVMTGLPVVIESADPVTGAPVTIAVDKGQASWDPVTSVVYAGSAASDCGGPSATECCDYINFFGTEATAAEWVACHPEITGGILDQQEALRAGIGIFGQLLA
jgi:hypothetical protein